MNTKNHKSSLQKPTHDATTVFESLEAFAPFPKHQRKASKTSICSKMHRFFYNKEL